MAEAKKAILPNGTTESHESSATTTTVNGVDSPPDYKDVYVRIRGKPKA